MSHQLGDEEFAHLARLLEHDAGLVFDGSRRDCLAYTVAERLRATGVRSVADYLGRLTDPVEVQALLDAVTIPETHFFRNPPQVRALRSHVLPELVREAAKREGRLRVWSAGCSTGEEPYTLAMLLRYQLPDLSGWDVRIVGTDISTRALGLARAGRYGLRSMVMTDPADVDRWFVRDGESFVVRDEVREMVEFRRHNMVRDAPPFDPDDVDLILCRNVTIYFARSTTQALMRRLHEQLRDGGYLFLGHSESLWQVSDVFHLVELGDAYVYRRDDTAAQAAENGQQLRRRVLPDRRMAERNAASTAQLEPERRVLQRRAGTPAEQRTPTVDELVTAARAALLAGDYGEAADRAQAAATVDPMRAEAWYVRGVALVNARNDAEALVALRKATYADPGAGYTHFVLAGVLARTGQATAAARAYRLAADTLGRPGDEIAPELGGRTLAELIALCHRLAETLERRSGPVQQPPEAGSA